MAIPNTALYEQVQLVIYSKIEEFKYYGYNSISKEELWQYCIEKKWRKKNVDEIPLYEVVATIFSVTPSDIISYSQIQGMKQSTTESGISQDEMVMLLQNLPISKNTQE